VTRKEVAVKKYVVRLRADERAQLNDMIHRGKRSAQLLTRARILLKADVSEAGEGWSDSRIAAALDTSIANILRTRRQLVEEGFEAVPTRKYNPNSKGCTLSSNDSGYWFGLFGQMAPRGISASGRQPTQSS